MLPVAWFRPWMAWAALAAAAAVLVGLQTMRLADERAAHSKTRAEHSAQMQQLERQALLQERAARLEEQRRTVEVQKAADEAQLQLEQARADAAAAGTAGQRLRDRIAQLTAACRPAASKAPTASTGPATDATADLLARVQQRLDDAADGIARYADEARAAGTACQRSYDALN